MTLEQTLLELASYGGAQGFVVHLDDADYDQLTQNNHMLRGSSEMSYMGILRVTRRRPPLNPTDAEIEAALAPITPLKDAKVSFPLSVSLSPYLDRLLKLERQK